MNTIENLTNVSIEMSSALEVISAMKKGNKLGLVIEGLKLEGKLQEVTEYIKNNIDVKEFEIELERKAFVDFVDGLERAIRIMEASKGYQEMGEINKQIAGENFHLEEEGANLGYDKQMDTAKSEGEAK